MGSFIDPHDQRRHDVTPDRLMYAAAISVGTWRRIRLARLAREVQCVQCGWIAAFHHDKGHDLVDESVRWLE